jgi:DNA-binding LacI/PurR family transcriptional regulator
MKSKTIYDIAREAGVGVATVSRALNNSGYVSAATRAKIQAAAVNYQLPESSRGRAQAPKTICLVISHEPSYFFINSTYTNAMLGICTVAKEKGYKLLLDIGAENRDYLTLFQEKQIDGIILMGGRKESGIVENILEHNIPFVLVGDYLKEVDRPFCRIDINDLKMAKEAVNHLIVLGHKKIGFIGGSTSFAPCENRLLGYMEALKQAGIQIRENYIVTCDNISEEKAYQLTKRLLYQSERVTAILAFNDMVAGAAYRAIHDSGLSVPEDISVIGFDDSELSKYISPPLTTVWQPSYEKGHKAASVLIDGIERHCPLNEIINLEGMLIYRKSCAAPVEVEKDIRSIV